MILPREQLEAVFEKLDGLLQHTPLSTSDGTRIACADEFMYMQTLEDGTHQFKHRFTRNYVFLVGNTLTVPVTDKETMRGTFDADPN